LETIQDENFYQFASAGLEQEREEIHRFLKKAKLESLGMEFFPAQPHSPKATCFAELEKSDLVLLIVPNNYGSINQETGKSFTHLEFDRAKELKSRFWLFCKKSRRILM
jgi:hypothetical protein